MKTCVVVIVLVGFMAYATEAQVLGSLPIVGTNIIGGQPATSNTLFNRYNYQASIQVNGVHICGGSIISFKSILTAANCASSGNVATLTVQVGSNELYQGTTYSISKINIHESYNPSSLQNNIAVLETTILIIFGPNVNRITLSKLQVNPNTFAFLTGWGSTSDPGQTVISLQKINYVTIESTICSQTLNTDVFPNENCATAGPPGSNLGYCGSDIGGPLVMVNANCQFTQIGIATVTIQSCGRGTDLFLSVPAMYDWIMSKAIFIFVIS